MNSSKVKIDLRVKKTRAAIENALMHLLETTSLSNITITALAREAHVSRKTFYLHYRSVDDLLEQIVRETVVEGIKELQPEAGLIDAEEWIAEFTRASFRSFFENPHLNANLVHSMTTDNFLRIVREPLTDVCAAELAKQGYEEVPNLEMYLSYYLGGMCSVYEVWRLSDGRESTLDKTARLVSDITCNGLMGKIRKR